MLETTMDFMQVLFGEKPENLYLLLWTLPDRRSYWFQSVEEFSQKAKQLKHQKKDVYVGVGARAENLGEWKRGETEHVVSIFALWADIDIIDAHHKKGNLPPDERAAMALVSEMGMEPTIIVHSGHGLQAWWAFKEPWLLDTTEERDKAQKLAQAWNDTFKERSKRKGWDADSVFDLARVLRVPGTVNYKGEPVDVSIISLNPEIRYDPTDFEAYLLDVSQEKRSRSYTRGEAGPLDLDPEANPPFDKFQMLADIEPKFTQSWNRTRKDLQDQSGSSYDLSLATYAAQVGWTDQEITDLIIASRRKHKDDLKLRQDYYARTIHRAREAIRKNQAHEAVENFAEELDEEDHAVTLQDAPELRQQISDSLSTLLGVKIKRIVKYLSDPPQYRLETGNSTIMLGEVQNLIGQTNFRNKVAAVAGKVIPGFKPGKWHGIAQLLLNLCEEEELGEETTDRGMAKMWLEEYLSEKPPIDDLESAVSQKFPFVKDKETYIFLADLQKWLFLNNNAERISARELGRILKTYDCQPMPMYVKLGLKATTKNVWKLPH